METLEEIIRKFEENKDRYSASFDAETGKFIRVGPACSFENEKHKINLEKELAEDILTAKIQISNCFVDITTGSLEIVENKSIRKIDDVLHRVPLIEFSEISNPDLFVTYDRTNNQFKFELSNELGGTKETKFKKKRNIFWSGDTVMYFYLTKYNDPHWILSTFDVKIQELSEKSKVYKNIHVPGKFSIFTKRILKNYVLEIK